MARTKIVERPFEAPMPVVWKSLGEVYPSLTAAYHQGPLLDVDREAELRDEMRSVLQTLLRSAQCDIANTTFVRYATKSMPELVIRYLVVDVDDRYPN